MAGQRTIEQLADAVVECVTLDAHFGVTHAEFDLIVRHPKEWQVALMDRVPPELRHRHVQVEVLGG